MDVMQWYIWFLVKIAPVLILSECEVSIVLAAVGTEH